MIYLASPYSDPDPRVERARFEAACDHAAQMMQDGQLVYSPVAHSHPLAMRGLPGDFAFWAAHNRAMLERCDALAVLTLPGWDRSVGVEAEIRMAEALMLPVRFVARVGAAQEVS